jgi:hypothetical protein
MADRPGKTIPHVAARFTAGGNREQARDDGGDGREPAKAGRGCVEADLAFGRSLGLHGDVSVNLVGYAVTGLVTLLGVSLGGWLSVRNQDRMWRRDHARQWRDIRLSTYQDFLSAYREFFAFVLDPTAKITAVPHPRNKGDMMPFFDEHGRSYREKLETARMAVSLVSEHPETRDALLLLMRRVRNLAAARAAYSSPDIPSETFEALFAAHDGKHSGLSSACC